MQAGRPAAPERAIGREREEGGQVLDDPVTSPDRGVTVLDPDVDVQAERHLAEDGLAVLIGQLAIAGRGDDRLVPPVAERMRPAPGEAETPPRGDPAERLELGPEVAADLGNVAADAAVDFHAAGVELGLDRTSNRGRDL